MAAVVDEAALRARVEGWIGRPRLQAAAWSVVEGAERDLDVERGEHSLRLLGFLVLVAAERLAAELGAAWIALTLRDLAEQAAEGSVEAVIL